MKMLNERLSAFLKYVPEEVYQDVYTKDVDVRLRPSMSFDQLLGDVDALYSVVKAAQKKYAQTARKLAESINHGASNRVIGDYRKKLEEAELAYNSEISELDKGKETIAYISFMILYRTILFEKERLQSFSSDQRETPQLEIDILRKKELLHMEQLKKAESVLHESMKETFDDKELIYLRQQALTIHDSLREIRLIRKDIQHKVDVAAKKGLDVRLSDTLMTENDSAYSEEKVKVFEYLNLMKVQLTMFLKSERKEQYNPKDSFIIKEKLKSLEKTIQDLDKESQELLSLFQ